MVVFILTLLFGWAGFYRFYKRQYFRGILYLFTFGLFYIGWLIDIVCALRDMIRHRTVPAQLPAPAYPPQQPVYPAPANNASATEADELMKYKRLLDNGAITKAEYEQKKRELLDKEKPENKFVVCPYCGSKNDKGAAKCTSCGAFLEI